MKAKSSQLPAATAAEEVLSRRIVAIARSARAGVILSVAESQAANRLLQAGAGNRRLIVANAAKRVCQELRAHGFETLLLPTRFLNRFKQAQFALATAVQKEKLAAGERVVCTVGSSVAGSDFILVMDVAQETAAIAVHELVKHTRTVRAPVMEAVINVACEIARAARRGKRLGAIFMLGDADAVLAGSRPLVPNPFEHLPVAQRSLLRPTLRELLVELAKLDGAFVARGDGLIETAGTFLSADPTHVQVPQGLGTRHLTAAAVTARTHGIAVVVSATDGHIRVFAHGDLVLHVDPESL
jgi:DNA integrity scanning protein DisA with diadenylate cyclase activity